MLLFMHFINSSQQGIKHMPQPGDHLLCMLCLPCCACFIICESCASELRNSRGTGASMLNASALHAAHAARQAIMMMTMHTLHALVITHYSAWSAGHKALYNRLHFTCQLLVLLDAESCCVLPPQRYVVLAHGDIKGPEEASNHSFSKLLNPVGRCYMSCDLACLAGHIVHGVKTPYSS